MSEPAIFSAILYPNQPPEPWQGHLLLGLATMIALILGAGFAIAGAWPVAGFFGLDIALLAFGFHNVRKRARRSETVRLNAQSLTVEADYGKGQKRAWQFEPYWVRVHMDEPPERHSLVTLSEKNKTLSLGRFLTPDERLSFAKALKAALRRWHNPSD